VPKQEVWEKRGSIFNGGQAHLFGLFGVIKFKKFAPLTLGESRLPQAASTGAPSSKWVGAKSFPNSVKKWPGGVLYPEE